MYTMSVRIRAQGQISTASHNRRVVASLQHETRNARQCYNPHIKAKALTVVAISFPPSAISPKHLPSQPPHIHFGSSATPFRQACTAKSPPGAVACSSPVLAATAAATAAPAVSHTANTTNSNSWTPCRDLAEWLQQAGGFVHPGVVLMIQRDHSGRVVGRELRCLEAVEPGGVLIRVPRTCQLRYDNENDPALRRLFEEVPKGTDSGNSAWQFKQALVLLYHYSLGTRSPLHFYLKWLPGLALGSNLPTLGMLMSDSAVQELQYGQALEDITNQKFWINSFVVNTLQPLASTADDPFGGMHMDRDLFAWAVAVTTSRCFGLHRFDPSRSTHTMTPLIDMADHSTQANSEIRGDTTTGEVTMSSSARILAGQPISLCYGQHDSSQLLLSYGFFTPGNERDRLAVDLDVEGLAGLILDLANPSSTETSDAAVLQSWQRHILEQLLHPDTKQQQQQHTSSVGSDESAMAASTASEVPKNVSRTEADSSSSSSGSSTQQSSSNSVMRVSFGGQPPVSPSLLAAVRVMTLQDNQRDHALSLPISDWGNWATPLSPTDELRALSTLAAFASALYQGLFPTTIQQDTALLATLQQDLDLESAAQDLPLKIEAQRHSTQTSNVNSIPSSLLPVAAAVAARTEAAATTAAEAESRGCHVRPNLALHDNDVIVAVRYRLEVKRALGRSVQQVIDRKAEIQQMLSKSAGSAILGGTTR